MAMVKKSMTKKETRALQREMDRAVDAGRLVRAAIVADRLGVSVRTIHGWAKEQLIPHVRLPEQKPQAEILFDPREIENWLKKKQIPVMTKS